MRRRLLKYRIELFCKKSNNIFFIKQNKHILRTLLMDASANVLETLKKDLETRGEQQVLEMQKNKTISQEGVVNIMMEGEKEFLEKIGRYMSYTEMRSIYG